MVMVGITGFDGTQSVDAGNRGEYEGAFFQLKSEIHRRAQDIASVDNSASEIQKAVAIEAAAILDKIAEEAASPCVMYVGKDVDAWDERVKHLRAMVDMTHDLIIESVIGKTGLSSDDPRLAKLNPIATEISELVSQAVEESIETAAPTAPTPSVPTARP